MSDRSLSRRQVLRAAVVSGAAGLASGAGTSAVLNDGESGGGNAIHGGTLDLSVLVEPDVDPCEWRPAIDGSGTATDAVLSESSGTIGIALSVCDNPGIVTLGLATDGDGRAEPVGDRGPEKRGDDGKRGERNGGKRRGRERDDKRGKRDDETGDGTDAADPTLRLFTCADGEETVLASGPLPTVVDGFADGVVLGGGCTSLGKLGTDDAGESFFVDGGDGEAVGEDEFVFGDVTVTVTDRHYEDGEVAGIDLAVDGGGLCSVDVKGGGPPAHAGGGGKGPEPGSGVKSYTFDCASEATGLYAPPNPRSGRQTAVSHVELSVCGGNGPACIPCAPDDPYAVFLEWSGLRAETDVELDLRATQCRYQWEDLHDQ